MSERGYVYHDHPRPFCGEGCPAYGESPLIQRYRKGSAMSERRTAAEDEPFIMGGINVDRLTAIIESRMSRDLAWLRDDGKTVSRWGPELVAAGLVHLYLTGDAVSGLPAIEAEAAAPTLGCYHGLPHQCSRCGVEIPAAPTPAEPHEDYAGRTCTTGLMHSHPTPSPSPMTTRRSAEPLDVARAAAAAGRPDEPRFTYTDGRNSAGQPATDGVPIPAEPLNVALRHLRRVWDNDEGAPEIYEAVREVLAAARPEAAQEDERP